MRKILHVDANNFYASVETLYDPSLKGKPVAVCGSKEKRHGIVLAKSNEAKSFGVKTTDTIGEALKKCPGLVMVRPNHDRYKLYSERLSAIYSDYTDRIEPFGIDECWLDVTNSTKLFGSATEIAESIRERTKKELGLTVSVGVSFTKIFAKLGSDLKKPDAVTVITPKNYKQKLWPLPVSELLMVGKNTKNVLNGFGIYTIGDLAGADREKLRRRLGINADVLIDSALGIGGDEVSLKDEATIPVSVSNSTTTTEDVRNTAEAEAVLTALCEKIASRLRKKSLLAGGVSIALKDNEFRYLTRRITVHGYTDSANIIFKHASELLKKNYDFKRDRPLRLIGAGVFNIIESEKGVQMSFFDEDKKKDDNLQKALDKIREKHGFDKIKKANTAAFSDLCDNLTTGGDEEPPPESD